MYFFLQGPCDTYRWGFNCTAVSLWFRVLGLGLRVVRSALRNDCAEVGTSCRRWLDVQQSRVEENGENGGDAMRI